jgi:hypothetical protein
MDLNFAVFATGVRICRASSDVGPLFVGPGSTEILEKNTFFSSIRVDPGPYIANIPENTYPLGKHGEIKVHRSNTCSH